MISYLISFTRLLLYDMIQQKYYKTNIMAVKYVYFFPCFVIMSELFLLLDDRREIFEFCEAFERADPLLLVDRRDRFDPVERWDRFDPCDRADSWDNSSSFTPSMTVSNFDSFISSPCSNENTIIYWTVCTISWRHPSLIFLVDRPLPNALIRRL